MPEGKKVLDSEKFFCLLRRRGMRTEQNTQIQIKNPPKLLCPVGVTLHNNGVWNSTCSSRGMTKYY